MDLSVHIDGASRGNPGPASAGIAIKQVEPPKVIHEAGYILGRMTNNVAEYQGLLRGLDLLDAILKAMKSQGIKVGRVHINSDSQLMVRQITGEYRVKSADLQPLLEEAQAKLLKLSDWVIRHVPREQNARADLLANQALDAGRDVILVAGPGTKAAVTPAGGGADSDAVSASASPSSAAVGKAGANTAPKYTGLRFRAWLVQHPGNACPARCPVKTPFVFGPGLPAGFCLHAAQAVFDENPTLWREAAVSSSQTECPKCGVAIEIESDSK